MFGLPSMLWWATAAAVPILIHLFARQRFRRVSWAAMEFLKRAFQKTKRRIRLENLLIMLLRVAALVLIALALADPRLKSSLLDTGPDSRREIVILFDNSFSMGYREASGETPFRRAHDQALKLVRALRSERGDTATLVTAGKPASLKLSRAADLDHVGAEIEKIEIADTATDIGGALRIAVSVLDGLPRGSEVFLLTDLQKVAILPPDESEVAPGDPASRPGADQRPSQLGSLLDQIKLRGGRVSVVPAGSGEADNLAVTDVRLASKVAVVNQPIKFSATVKNFGQRPASGVLNLFVDGTEAGVESQTIDLLAAGGTHAADFQHTFREAGPHEVDVRFTTDALEIDNRRALSTIVENRLAVLIVDGSAKTEPGEEASYFLKTALELGATPNRPAVFQVKTVSDVAFDGENLADWDLVALTNVASLSDRRAKELEEFVKRGGGFIVFLGDRTSPPNMNDLLWKGGEGILPASIGAMVGEINTRQPAYEIRPLVLDRPPLDYFADERIRATLIHVPIYRFFSVMKKEGQNDVRVLAQFETTKAAVTPPSPAVLEKPFGRGRTILVTTSADREWNELAVFPTYVPLVREMAFHLVRRSARFENLLVGDTYRRDLDRFVDEVIVERAGKQLEVIKPVARTGGGFEITIDPLKNPSLAKAGVYKLTYVEPKESAEKPLRPTFIAVNVDSRESDLARLKPETLASFFTPDQLRVVDSVDAEQAARAEPDENSWWWITLLVLLVLVAESALAQLFGRSGRGGAA